MGTNPGHLGEETNQILAIFDRLISPRAVCPPPAGLEVVSLFVSFDTIPASMVQAIVCADGFDNVSRLAITAFATVDPFVLTWCHRSLVEFIIVCLPGDPPAHA